MLVAFSLVGLEGKRTPRFPKRARRDLVERMGGWRLVFSGRRTTIAECGTTTIFGMVGRMLFCIEVILSGPVVMLLLYLPCG